LNPAELFSWAKEIEVKKRSESAKATGIRQIMLFLQKFTGPSFSKQLYSNIYMPDKNKGPA
jgi:hypothetical protein